MNADGNTMESLMFAHPTKANDAPVWILFGSGTHCPGWFRIMEFGPSCLRHSPPLARCGPSVCGAAADSELSRWDGCPGIVLWTPKECFSMEWFWMLCPAWHTNAPQSLLLFLPCRTSQASLFGCFQPTAMSLHYVPDKRFKKTKRNNLWFIPPIKKCFLSILHSFNWSFNNCFLLVQTEPPLFSPGGFFCIEYKSFFFDELEICLFFPLNSIQPMVFNTDFFMQIFK
jgi:hypothetical protein